MKTIEDLTVKVTYKVGLGGLNVSEKIHKQLNEIAENSIELDGMGMDYPEASDWLKDNIRERDCCNLEYEIEELP
jgi:hypothetical protein